MMGLVLSACLLLAVTAEEKPTIMFGVIMPETSILTRFRKYTQAIDKAVEQLYKPKYWQQPLNFLNFYELRNTKMSMLPINPSPRKIMDALCDKLLPYKVITIMYISTKSDAILTNTASSQYLLQLTSYLGIPVIAWNADNVGLWQKETQSHVLQLAPSVKHQAAAMLSLLQRYSWHQFSVVTTQINGHNDFVQSVRDQVQASEDFKFRILQTYVLKSMDDPPTMRKELFDLAGSEARVFLLYSSIPEAKEIFAVANDLQMTGKNYMWILASTAVGTSHRTTYSPGILGVSFDTKEDRMLDEVTRAVNVLAYGLEVFLSDSRNANVTLQPDMNCSSEGDLHWREGEYFFKYLQNLTVQGGSNAIEFNADGSFKYVEVDIYNLNSQGNWNKIGHWTESGLYIKDIVWPGDSPVPPPGLPEKFNMRVTFMEEAPYITMVPADNETGECKSSRAVRCRVAQDSEMERVNYSVAIRDPRYYMCCSGFCVDLLEKFASELRFTYEMYRVADGIWGVLNDGKWNGLVRELLLQRSDIIVTSFKINSERQTAVDFTVPFMETGIAIVVAKKTGIISPKAFLEPFDTISWLMILLISIQAAAFAIFLFEWLSPSGYDMKMTPPREHRFSLFRTYWLVWAILFGAAVNVDCPRGYTSRFMSNVWAMFAVVFLAIYTANLAAFMITREEYYDLTGIEDDRLYNPRKMEPPFRYGTIPYGNTEAVLRKNKPQLFYYMRNYNRSTVSEGIESVKKGELDAFIYDATVLEYLVGQDNECRLLTVGSWYSMTGYGFAMPKKSKYLNMFNKKMIEFKESGDIERLQRFWLQGICKPQHQKRNASNPLDINQFMSAFLLLGCGVLFTILLLGLEHVYFRYCRKHLSKKDSGGCFTLVSLSMGKSLTFRGAVYEAQDMIKHHRCKDPVCDTQLWKARHQLDMARLKIQELEAELKGTRYYPAVNALKPRDLTRNHVTTNEPVASRLHAGQYYKPLYTEIAEIETVL